MYKKTTHNFYDNYLAGKLQATHLPGEFSSIDDVEELARRLLASSVVQLDGFSTRERIGQGELTAARVLLVHSSSVFGACSIPCMRAPMLPISVWTSLFSVSIVCHD